ncbi:MAG: glycosyltransferase family 39 protein, partial [Anaerolineales bacterium]|nr:glycosyltransferase family 39 protein [Anaerolineales bacterium]
MAYGLWLPMSIRHSTIRQSYGFPLLWFSYIFIAALFAIFTPAWQTPDEPAHFNYVRQLAEGNFPVMERGDYSQTYFGEVVSSRFDPTYDLDPFSYEDYQPPLFYLLQTPIFWLTGGSLIGLRLFSVMISSVTLIVVYMVAWQVFDGRVHLALTAAGFWAFLPQHMAIMASVNNDVLSELWIAVMLWLLISYRPTAVIRQTQHAQYLLLLGIVLGLAFLTKVTAYLMAPVIFLVLFYHYIWRPERRWQLLVRSSLLVFVPAGLIGSLWWGRNLLVYGWPDFLGIAAHDAVVIGQPTTAVWLAQYGPVYVLNAFVQTTFQSFWGQFGWMAVPMPRWV